MACFVNILFIFLGCVCIEEWVMEGNFQCELKKV